MAKVGRPPLEITPELISKAEALAAQGLTQEQIASVLGIGLSTLMNKKAKFKEFGDAIKRGQDKGIATISNALFNKAKQGDNVAMLFYLKCRAGWREQEPETKEIPSIIINTVKE